MLALLETLVGMESTQKEPNTLSFRRGEYAGHNWQDFYNKALAYAEAPATPFTDTYWKVGMIRVPKGIKIESTRWDLVIRAHIAKFIRHYEKQGWTLDNKPLIRKVPILPDNAPWNADGIFESDPRVDDRDMYEVGAYFKRRPVAATLLLPDHMADNLPPGLKLTS